jgi:cyclic pyranopterin phosphate synthase
MDVGNRNGWCRDQVMPAQEMIQLLHRHWPIQPIGRPVAGTSPAVVVSRWWWDCGHDCLH